MPRNGPKATRHASHPDPGRQRRALERGCHGDYGLLQSVTKRDIEIKFELRNEGLMYKDNVSDLHSREINDPLEVIQPNSVKKFESLIPTRRDVGFLASVTQSSFDNPNRKPPLFIEVDPGTRMRWEMVEDETCGDG